MFRERRIYRYDSLRSTNDEAKRLAALGEPEGTVVIAENQTAGRGRAGRQWISLPGSALTLTIILRPQLTSLHLTQIALLGGLAVLEGLRRVTDLPAQIKWPNDVLVHGKKVAGVLAEATFAGDKLESVVLGIGVNVNAAPAPDLNLEYAATSLAGESGFRFDREAVLEAILTALEVRYPQLGLPSLAAAWFDHLAMQGEPVQIIGMLETLTGRIEGIESNGALLIRLENGDIRPILTGDVHLRKA